MNVAWYFLTIEDDAPTLYRCSPTGFESVPLRPPRLIPDDPDVEAHTTQAAVPQSHSPYAPGSAGKLTERARPRATRAVDDDPMNAAGAKESYLRHLGHAVTEAIAPQPAPLYVVAEEEHAALFEIVGKTEVRGFLYTPQESPSVLWSETRQLEIAA